MSLAICNKKSAFVKHVKMIAKMLERRKRMVFSLYLAVVYLMDGFLLWS